MLSWLCRWLPVILWCLVIFFTSADPDPYRRLPENRSAPVLPSVFTIPERNETVGRLSHVGEYAVLAALLTRSFSWQRRVSGKSSLKTLAFASLFALSDEIHQEFVPGRAFELGDLALDLIGPAPRPPPGPRLVGPVSLPGKAEHLQHPLPGRHPEGEGVISNLPFRNRPHL